MMCQGGSDRPLPAEVLKAQIQAAVIAEDYAEAARLKELFVASTGQAKIGLDAVRQKDVKTPAHEAEQAPKLSDKTLAAEPSCPKSPLSPKSRKKKRVGKPAPIKTKYDEAKAVTRFPQDVRGCANVTPWDSSCNYPLSPSPPPPPPLTPKSRKKSHKQLRTAAETVVCVTKFGRLSKQDAIDMSKGSELSAFSESVASRTPQPSLRQPVLKRTRSQLLREMPADLDSTEVTTLTKKQLIAQAQTWNKALAKSSLASCPAFLKELSRIFRVPSRVLHTSPSEWELVGLLLRSRGLNAESHELLTLVHRLTSLLDGSTTTSPTEPRQDTQLGGAEDTEGW